MVTQSQAEAVVNLLRLHDADARRRAVQQLASWEHDSFDQDAAAFLIASAAEEYPLVEGAGSDVPNDELIRPLWFDAQSLSPAVIVEHLPRLRGDAHWAAMRLLAHHPSKAAAVALAAEIGRMESGVWPPFLVFAPLEEDPRHSDVLVPLFLDLLTKDAWRSFAAGLLLAYAVGGLLTGEQESRAAELIVPDVVDALDALHAEIETSGPTIVWDEDSDYAERRSDTGMLLDLIGRLRYAEPTITLSAAAAHVDPWLSMWGVIGLVRNGQTPPPDSLARVAADPESRLILFEELTSMGQVDLMPVGMRTQEMLAEGEMVRWLKLGSELGRPPDQIEHVAVLPMQDDEGPADLHVLKFRTFPPHWAADEGWMLGIAGPYLRQDQPTTETLGATFSVLDPYDENMGVEQVDAMLATLESWAGGDSD